MKKTITAIMATAVLSVAVTMSPAIAGQKTLPHWNSWPGTIWGATESAGHGPVTCEIPRTTANAGTVQLVAQSVQDCTDAGGVASS